MKNIHQYFFSEIFIVLKDQLFLPSKALLISSEFCMREAFDLCQDHVGAVAVQVGRPQPTKRFEFVVYFGLECLIT